MDMDLEMAESVLRGAKTSVIDTMENVKSKWDLHCSGHDFFVDDDEFFEFWQYEVNAYNVMYKAMKPLFATA
jgi:hypothetical protein|tara:strand:- start:785 stop:1000 length:216 start_codon:yes stop_codon:yes gene_type:complete